MSNRTFIRTALDNLNDINNGIKKFELFCNELIPTAIDDNFHPSSGIDAGGDGGIDAWSISVNGEKIKYAFSIQKKYKTKIKEEIENTNSLYKQIRYFSNQPISEKNKHDLYIMYNHIDLTIYARETIVRYVEENEHLGVYIDLPRILSEVQINYIKKHNQLSEQEHEIRKYIPRLISYYNYKEKREEIETLYDYIQNRSIAIIQAPAGYGKSCILQQLYLETLDNKDVSPPVFIDLSDFTPGSLRVQIEDKLSLGGDYRAGDYILLLDGYDEVKDKYKETLRKEIRQKISQSHYKRRIVLTVRENTFRISDFDSFYSRKLAGLEEIPSETTVTSSIAIGRLAPLNNKDIKKLFTKNGIENFNVFFNNSLFLNFNDNIFYVTIFIEYYKKYGSIADDIIKLFDFIVKQEIQRVFKKLTPDLNNIEAIALYMTVYQKQTLKENDDIFENNFIELPLIPFKFSHKSIQEYLAAKKISTLNFNYIKAIFSIDGIIIPYLTNTFGLVLNILKTNIDTYAKFENLIKWALNEKGNVQKLLQIESDKIDPDINHLIFKIILEKEAPVIDLFNLPIGLMQFINTNYDNVKTLIGKIVESSDYDSFSMSFYTSLLQNIYLHYPNVIKKGENKKLLEYFLQLLGDIKNPQKLEFINSLFFSLCYNTELKNLTKGQINSIIDVSLSIHDHNSRFNNLCELLINTKQILDYNNYIKLFKFAYEARVKESRQIASWVPREINDDYKTSVMHTVYIFNFFPLSEQFLSGNLKMLWKLVDDIINNFPTFLTNYGMSHDFKDFLKNLYDEIESDILVHRLNKNKIDALSEWVVLESKSHNESSLLQKLKEILNLDNDNLWNLSKQIVSKAKERWVVSRDLVFYFYPQLKVESDFNKLQKFFNDTGNKYLQDFYDSFIRFLPEEHCLYDIIQESIPEAVKIKNKEIKKDKEKYKTFGNKEDNFYIDGLHIIFNKHLLVDKIKECFERYGGEKIEKNDYFSSDNYSIDKDTNPFVENMISTYLREEKDIATKQDFLNYFDSSRFDRYWGMHLAYYMSHFRIDFKELNESEIIDLKNWVKETLTEYPLDTVESAKYEIQRIACQILRVSDIFVNDEEFKDNYQDKIWGAAYSGFTKGLEGSFSVNYDSYSIDYLEKYISTNKLIAYIVNNFSSEEQTDRSILSICGYLTTRIDYLFTYQFTKMKKEIIKYLNKNIKLTYHAAVLDLSTALKIQISDIEKENFIGALEYKKNGLEYNYASSYLTYPKYVFEDTEKKILLSYIQKAFEQSGETLLKKTLAEYYIKMNKMAGEIFAYYAHYLLEDDNHTIKDAHGGFGAELSTADINHLDIVKDLIIYSVLKNSNRRSAILKMALDSYKLIAENATDRSDIDKIVNSMKEFFSETGKEFILIHIREIETSFAEKIYKPLTIEEILQL